jgi:hypothetical protein
MRSNLLLAYSGRYREEIKVKNLARVKNLAKRISFHAGLAGPFFDMPNLINDSRRLPGEEQIPGT